MKFLQTVVGKITVATVVVLVILGAVFVLNSSNDKLAMNYEVISEGKNKTEESEAVYEIEDEIETGSWVEVTDAELTEEELAALLQGDLSIAQFKFVLGYGPEIMQNRKVSLKDLNNLLLYMATSTNSSEIGLEKIKNEDTMFTYYDVEKINNYISILTDYQYSENDNDIYGVEMVRNNQLAVSIAEPAGENLVTINDICQKDKIIYVNYLVDKSRYEFETGDIVHKEETRSAVLKENVSGKYQITDIINDCYIKDMENAYQSVLEKMCQNHLLPNGIQVEDITEDVYAIYDVNGDGLKELIVKHISGFMYEATEFVCTYNNYNGMVNVDFMGLPSLVYYNNGFVREDASHNQSDDIDAWPYTMYRYNDASNTYDSIGVGVANDGSIENYVGTGNEVELEFVRIAE